MYRPTYNSTFTNEIPVEIKHIFDIDQEVSPTLTETFSGNITQRPRLPSLTNIIPLESEIENIIPHTYSRNRSHSLSLTSPERNPNAYNYPHHRQTRYSNSPLLVHTKKCKFYSSQEDSSGEVLLKPSEEFGTDKHEELIRESHKLAERQRRKQMKSLFEDLKKVLPSDRRIKYSKGEVLSQSINYIQHLVKENNFLKHQLHSLAYKHEKSKRT